MPKKKDNKLTDDDKQFFRQAVEGVRPITPEERITPVKKPPPPRPLQHELDEQQVLTDMMSDPIDLRDVEIGDELYFARSGIQTKVQRKLRRGEFSIEAELDLHGYTVAEAKTAIHEFFADCKKYRQRCVRIIHGKGHGSEKKIPILKTYVAHWLTQRDDVMAYASARPADGGTGALYVLLKTKN